TCALRRDGSPACWGAGTSASCTTDAGAGGCADRGQAMPPSGQRFIQISAGLAHTCGLRADGSVSCWGAGKPKGTGLNVDSGQAAPPSEGRYKFISAGTLHTCGVNAAHKTECWGMGPTPSDSGNALRAYAGLGLTCVLKGSSDPGLAAATC